MVKILLNRRLFDKVIKNDYGYIPKYDKDDFVTPFQIIAADFESVKIGKQHKLFMYSLFSNSVEYCYYNRFFNKSDVAESFIRKLFSIKTSKKIFVYMHNLGGFDGILLLDALKRSNPFLSLITYKIRNNSYYEIKVGSDIYIRDSYKLFTCSLNDLSQSTLGLSKLEVDYTIFLSKASILKNLKLIKRYCLYDSELLFKSLELFENQIVRLYSISIIRAISISSLALKIYRKHFYTKFLIANANQFSDSIFTLILESYRGGIVDVYKPEGKNLYHYDINSSYPSAMLNPMPVGLPLRVSGVGEEFDINSFFGFLTVHINVKYNKIPFLGYRSTSVSGNVYPYGDFITTVFSEELKYALTVNKVSIIKVISAVSFDPQKIFSKYVEEMYSRRINALSPEMKMLYKNLLNCLYGRFGMRRDLETVNQVTKNELSFLEILYTVRILVKLAANRFLVSVDTSPNPSISDISKLGVTEISKVILIGLRNNVFWQKKKILIAPQISSAIAAYARIKVDRKKREVMQVGGEVYYSDTDSIVCDRPIKTSNFLGGWKLEGLIEQGYFLAPKVYLVFTASGKKVSKFKGIPKEKLMDMTITEEYDRICNTVISEINDPIQINIENSFKKKFYNTCVQFASSTYSPKFILKKRSKIYNNHRWVDTEPIKVSASVNVFTYPVKLI